MLIFAATRLHRVAPQPHRGIGGADLSLDISIAKNFFFQNRIGVAES
jgi:hypothetical protein